MKTRSTRMIATGGMLSMVLPTWAHDGHGLAGSHWHATDTWGLVAVAVALAVALWLSRGGR